MNNRIKKKNDNELKNNISDIKETINKNSDTLDNINTSNNEIFERVKQIDENTKSKLSKKIIGIVSFVLAVSGVSIVAVYQLFSSAPATNTESPSISNVTKSTTSEISQNEEYKIYLTSEYKNLTVYQDTLMTVNTEFVADSVVLIADSGDGDIYELPMDNKSKYEWVLNVDFFKEGTYEITAVANSSDHEAKAYITVEVNSYSDALSPFFDIFN